ncbi:MULTISPECIES: hypothetical protein [unclassified Diaminobutyricimonas]|uniref:hypothetical protein n=1 Tax=unclassified Diaminobutyricimonas TaxID=2643261 RepID=UPI0012F4FDD1|nr:MULTISPECIES: hypothetical protein [unclassified Diaminobutyricimonas]
MGFLDRLLGRENSDEPRAPRQNTPAPAAQSDDQRAVERYRYLLRTAPPETIEQVHEEAFTKLTPEQRRMLFDELTRNAPAGEQPRGDDAHSLAQSATRSELRRPGTMERSMGGPSFGSMLGASLLGTVAGYVVGSALVGAFLPGPEADAAAGDSGAESADAGGGDTGGADTAGAEGGDFGGDFGGGFGDFGGGDFGGGDFGI